MTKAIYFAITYLKPISKAAEIEPESFSLPYLIQHSYSYRFLRSTIPQPCLNLKSQALTERLRGKRDAMNMKWMSLEPISILKKTPA